MFSSTSALSRLRSHRAVWRQPFSLVLLASWSYTTPLSGHSRKQVINYRVCVNVLNSMIVFCVQYVITNTVIQCVIYGMCLYRTGIERSWTTWQCKRRASGEVHRETTNSWEKVYPIPVCQNEGQDSFAPVCTGSHTRWLHSPVLVSAAGPHVVLCTVRKLETFLEQLNKMIGRFLYTHSCVLECSCLFILLKLNAG